ncbi:RNA polymerase sigma factor [Aliikangiella sp. G2MR2-5]|uniref:RNA polymerase sigma factor n=1 Tax=Aliikangiella sp. G2MR2-5 TaxID=2788943 RepID=UPI0018A8FA89|nr:sigma-70 family RNA polymerase sigma factor [Aliikangiella sp. G2MR2-5]
MNKQQHTAKIADLANQYGRQVFQTAFRLLGDSHLAEDITQEVFLKLFKKTPEAFDKILNWPAYLKSMASSSAIDQLRRHKRLSEQPLEPGENQTSSLGNQEAKDPFGHLATQRDLASFRKALTALTAQDAQVFCLRHVEEMSYREIADLLDISTSLVGVTLHRAQQKLSQLLGESQFLGAGYEITG